LDTVSFTDAKGNKIEQNLTSMLSTLFLDLAAETLCRGFGVTVTLTLVEFENAEMAQNASPWGKWSRAVPILDKNQEVKSMGDLVIELARLMGECTYCKNDKEECNKTNASGECRFVKGRRTAVEAVTAEVNRQVMVQAVPVAKLRGGEIVPTPAAKLLGEEVMQAAYDMSQEKDEKEQAAEEGEITEEPTTATQEETDKLFGNDSSSVLNACTSASNCEEKHS
jgi:hypothetical protein